ncbi:MAG: hypothetical protein ACR2IE_13385 [Candidatus Sumerlaeaceae bacterium]
MATILLGSVAAMLYAMRNSIRASDDRIAYEENYHCAMSGLAAAKYWLFKHGVPAKAQLAGTMGNTIDALASGSVNLSNYVRENATGSNTPYTMSGQAILQKYTQAVSTLGTGDPALPGGRRVLAQLGSDDSKLIFLRRDVPEMNTQDLFEGTDTPRSYVSKIRFTTPYGNDDPTNYQPDDLRRVSIIVEATAVTKGQGVKKVRTLQQKLLVVPVHGESEDPILGPVAGVAFGGGAVTVTGVSSLKIHWGPVWSKANIELLQLAFTPTAGTAVKTLAAGSDQQGKFYGAGTLNDGLFEKWVKYQTAGLFTTTGGTPIFKDSASTSLTNPTINGVPVKDLFVQIVNGSFGANWGSGTNNKLRLDGVYKDTYKTAAGVWAGAGLGPGILYDNLGAGQNQYTTGTGALVQRDASMIGKVDNLINTQLDYNTWKQFAIANNSYIRPANTGNGFVNQVGQTLYVTPARTLSTSPTGNSALTDLKQISIPTSLIPADGNTAKLRDRILFIDNKPNGQFGSVAIKSGFFWKGLMYVHGGVDIQGAGASGNVLLKNPDEYKTDPTGSSTGTKIGNIIMDGVMLVEGTLSRSGNAAIYGSLVAKGGYSGNGTVDIYYNSRNAGGLFKEVVDDQTISQIITGPTMEI